MKIIVTLFVLFATVSAWTQHVRPRRSSPVLPSANVPDGSKHSLVPSFIKEYDDVDFREIFKFESEDMAKLVEHYAESLSNYGNVSVFGWQEVGLDDEREVFEFDIMKRPVKSDILVAKALEQEPLEDMAREYIKFYRTWEKEVGKKLMGAAETYNSDGDLIVNLHMEPQEQYYEEIGENWNVAMLEKNLTVSNFAGAKKIADEKEGTYGAKAVLVFDKDNILIPEESHIVPELFGLVEDQRDASLEQIEAGLKFTVEGHFKDENTRLSYVRDKMEIEFPGYSWIVIPGSSVYDSGRDDIFIKIYIYISNSEISIFGNKK